MHDALNAGRLIGVVEVFGPRRVRRGGVRHRRGLAPAGHWLARSRYALGRASGCHHAADGHLAQQLAIAPARPQGRTFHGSFRPSPAVGWIWHAYSPRCRAPSLRPTQLYINGHGADRTRASPCQVRRCPLVHGHRSNSSARHTPAFCPAKKHSGIEHSAGYLVARGT
jgi:hypothetical protein